jgi:hypothetical protein
MAEELEDILQNVQTLVIDGKPVTIQPNRLSFNEANLSRFLDEEAVWYDHFGNAVAEAEAELQMREAEWDILYSQKFSIQKDEGATEKLAEARSKADPEVQAAKKAIINAKKNVKRLQQHLRAWDHCHANAQNRGNTLRKEMDKLGVDIRSGNNSSDPFRYTSDLEDKVNSIIGHKEEE